MNETLFSANEPLDQVVNSFNYTALLGAVLIVVGLIAGVVMGSLVIIIGSGVGGAMFLCAGILGRIRVKQMIRIEMLDPQPEDRYSTLQL